MSKYEFCKSWLHHSTLKIIYFKCICLFEKGKSCYIDIDLQQINNSYKGKIWKNYTKFLSHNSLKT